MAIYKRCGRCGKRLPSGTKCDCLKERHKEYDKYSRDKKADGFYHSKEWKITRDTVLTLDCYVDVYAYMEEHRVVAADMVHHIEPLRDNWDKRFDIGNLISLSSDTHSKIEQMYKNDKGGMIEKLNQMVNDFRKEIGNG